MGKLIYAFLLIYASWVELLIGAPAGSGLDYAALTFCPVERRLFLNDFILGDLYHVVLLTFQILLRRLLWSIRSIRTQETFGSRMWL